MPLHSCTLGYLGNKVEGKVFTLWLLGGQEPPSGEFTTAECGVNYQLVAVNY